MLHDVEVLSDGDATSAIERASQRTLELECVTLSQAGVSFSAQAAETFHGMLETVTGQHFALPSLDAVRLSMEQTCLELARRVQTKEK